MDKTQENYIDHEVRIRMLEILNKKINLKMNAGLGLILSGIVVPILLKHWGF
jgi:hypothetical protein